MKCLRLKWRSLRKWSKNLKRVLSSWKRITVRMWVIWIWSLLWRSRRWAGWIVRRMRIKLLLISFSRTCSTNTCRKTRPKNSLRKKSSLFAMNLKRFRARTAPCNSNYKSCTISTGQWSSGWPPARTRVIRRRLTCLWRKFVNGRLLLSSWRNNLDRSRTHTPPCLRRESKKKT